MLRREPPVRGPAVQVDETFDRRHNRAGSKAHRPSSRPRSGGRDASTSGIARRGRRLEYGTTVWNTLEAFVAIGSGVASHSLALVAFGLDSCVEVLASIVVLWHLGGATEEADPRRARRAMRLIAVAFGALGVFLAAASVRGVLTRETSEPSGIGIGFMAATVMVMFFLAAGKK